MWINPDVLILIFLNLTSPYSMSGLWLNRLAVYENLAIFVAL